MKFTKAALTALTLSSFAFGAQATLVLTNGLQNGLNNITQDGVFGSGDANIGQSVPDEVFQMDASGGSINTLVFEFAGFAASTSFGIYDLNDTSNQLEIFEGSNVQGNITASINGGTVNYSSFNFATGTLNTATFSSTQFGYYLDSSASNGGGLFFSQSALNTDVGHAGTADETTDHMVMYAGDGSDSLSINGGAFGVFGANEYILAWEDLAFPSSDFDYSDMVVLVESVTPVPTPATLALFGLGLLGMGAVARKRKQA